jgi:HAD superfamily hydrolase (TIGR01509 family)
MNREAAIGVGFDIDHTLAIDNKLERVAFLRLLEPIANDGGVPPQNLFDEIDRIDALLVAQRAGRFTIDDAVRGFVAERGILSTRADAYVERFRTMALGMVDEFVIPLPGAKAMLEALAQRGIRTAVLSNGWNPLQDRKARCAGFDGPVLASASLGCQKPDAHAFEALIDALGTRPGETWYVGDDPRADVAGAHDAGLRAVWLDAEKKPFPPEIAPPHYTIRSLTELPDLLASAMRLA